MFISQHECWVQRTLFSQFRFFVISHFEHSFFRSPKKRFSTFRACFEGLGMKIWFDPNKTRSDLNRSEKRRKTLRAKETQKSVFLCVSWIFFPWFDLATNPQILFVISSPIELVHFSSSQFHTQVEATKHWLVSSCFFLWRSCLGHRFRTNWDTKSFSVIEAIHYF